MEQKETKNQTLSKIKETINSHGLIFLSWTLSSMWNSKNILFSFDVIISMVSPKKEFMF